MTDFRLPKYCRTCGEKLHALIELESYDEMTGVEICKITLTCPNYSRILGLNHDKRSFDADGDEVIKRYDY
jgi:hypothetical protein